MNTTSLLGSFENGLGSNQLSKRPLPNSTGNGDHFQSSPRHSAHERRVCDRLKPPDPLDACSLSSVDVLSSNDLKFMDDSTSSSSSSSISCGADNSSAGSLASDSTVSMHVTKPTFTRKHDNLSSRYLSHGPCKLSDLLYPNSASDNLQTSAPITENGMKSKPAGSPARNFAAPTSSLSPDSDQDTRINFSKRPSRIPVPTKTSASRPVNRPGSTPGIPPASAASETKVPNPSGVGISGSLSEPNKLENGCPSPLGSRSFMNSSPAQIDEFYSAEKPHANRIEQISELSNRMPEVHENGEESSSSPVSKTSSRVKSFNHNGLQQPSSSLLESNRCNSASSSDGFPLPREADDDARLRDLLAMVSDSESDTESIAESIYHQPPKAADRGAASRLAKRLFNLDGFRITDVAKHLCKRNDFSQLVGEEFASLFDFTGQRLDVALRSFLNTFSLTGETQERERILLHFSRRYQTCNPGTYATEDACHTLVCALMLLNTDLHNQGVTRKMTSQEFINNLTQMQCGDCFSREELKTLYSAIKQEPIRWPHADAGMMGFVNFYYPGPNGAFGPTGQGFLAPGFCPNPQSSQMMMLGVPPSAPGTAGGFNPYPLIHYQHPSLQTPNWAYLANPANISSQQAMLANSALGLTPSLYWNSANSPLIGSLATGTMLTQTGGFTGASLAAPLPSSESAGMTPRKLGIVSGANPFIDLAAETTAREYMRGLLVRKWVMESHGKKASLGRRGWKVYYARLRDLVLYLYKNSVVANAATRAEELHNLYQQQQQHQSCLQQLALQQHQLALLQQQQQQQQQQQPQREHQQPGDGQSDEPISLVNTQENGEDSNPLTMKGKEADAVGLSDLNGISEPECSDSSSTFTTNKSEKSGTARPPSPPTTVCEDVSNYSADIQEVVSTTSASGSTTATITSLPGPFPTVASTSPDIGPSDFQPNCAPFSSPVSSHPLSYAAPAPAFVPPPIPPPEAVVRIAHALASRATDYQKKPNVFRLKTREGAEYLFEVVDAKELDMWVERINFVAALLSAPSMPGPIGSEKGFYRPHLPVTCTKLNMREQLEEHQRRLIELGRELTELRKRPLTGCGSKKSAPVLTRAQTVASTTGEDGMAGASADILGSGDTDSKMANNVKENEIKEPASKLNEDSSRTVAITPSTTVTTSSSASSLISVFSTASLGRRRKTSSGSLGGTVGGGAGGTLERGGSPALSSKQRAEYEERIQFTESEINRYKTYARLLEAELFRIQQSSAAVAQAAAMAAASSFSPFIGPYNPLNAGAFPGAVGFQPYAPPNAAPAGHISFPTPPPPPRYFPPRDPNSSYVPSSGVPLTSLSQSDTLNEEPSQPTAEPTSSSSSSPDHLSTSTVTAPTTSEAVDSVGPAVQSNPAYFPMANRVHGLPSPYFNPQFAPPTPFSPSVSGRFYQHPRQWRAPHHPVYYRQPPIYGTPTGTIGRTNGIMSNGHHQLTEEEPITEPSSHASATVDSTPATTSGDQATPNDTVTPSSTTSEKFKLPQISRPVCPTDGMFYEIV